MTGSDGVDYYALRERQARTLAARADLPNVREIHLDMADRYARLSRRALAAYPILAVIDGGRPE